jgi:ribose transport system ATP-binding protein
MPASAPPPRVTPVPAAVAVRGVSKSFGGRTVLRDVSLSFDPGEFVGLLGANGAGKSTLIKILDGVYRPDTGSVTGVVVDGCKAVGVVHQDLGIAPNLSILENVRLGLPPLRTRVGTVDRLAERRAARAALASVGIDARLDAAAASLGPRERVLLAVARLDPAATRLVVLDEVTASLTEEEAEGLLSSLRAAAVADASFLMVSHRLSEVAALATRVVVLRDGQVVVDSREPVRDVERLAAMLAPGLTGISAPGRGRVPNTEDVGVGVGDPLLALRGVCAGSRGPLDLVVRAGEVVGVTSRLSSTLHDLALVAIGSTRPDAGQVVVDPRQRRAFVAPDRVAFGNFASLPVRWNLTAASLWRWRGRARTLSLTRERQIARQMVDELGVDPPDPAAEQRTLSGGNQQKVLFGRALLCDASVYVLCEPTRGVDVATRERLYGVVRGIKQRGGAVLVISTDPHDVLALSDRVIAVDESWRVMRELDEVAGAHDLAEVL